MKKLENKVGVLTGASSGIGAVIAKSLSSEGVEIVGIARSMAKELQNKCDRTHEHQVLLDGRAAGAERYPPGLYKAICRGIVREKKERTLHI